ncbi:DUF4255 domain-containing protein [Chitinophaga agrisoli]|uniref:DUF4255 domain-containing protein n=1 Tax=Chitinophaga agrisoli TaxID=2607653 RepID=A0A5B2VJY6_9BACT|nr:DUF4255 domain-containing protein [Chitinophaga agrisoli]KAA2239275.1 DUF4255 domain-containing protein [Chitinophaga agrisoli]
MIRTSLKFIKKELETYIVDREQDPLNYNIGNVVDLKPVVKANGELNVTDSTHVTIMMAGVEEERRESKRPVFVPAPDKKILRLNPPVELDLLILFIAHNSDYETALRDLSNVASFFQANPVFDEQRFPGLNEFATEPINKPWQLVERLTFKLLSLSFEQQNNLWGMLGGKYIPSLVYKMNMLTVFETRSQEKIQSIKALNIKEN